MLSLLGMKYSSKLLSQTLVQLCLAKGIKHIVISPGSRNAPLTIGFTALEEFHCYSIVDERCAAFFGIGLAQQLKEPVALVCTSGSALLNYYPAIAEAFYSNLPLMVFSADRPKERIDIGDGQTIRQENIFEKHIRYSANLKEGEEFQNYNEEQINKALDTALLTSGPIHINVPFSEPLYELVEIPSIYPSPVLVPERQAWNEDITGFIEKWNQSKKKIILVGTLDPKCLDEEIVNQLGSQEDLLVLTETLSNLNHPNFIPAIDQLITSLSDEEFRALQPEVLITIGGMVVSKRVKAFLRKFPPLEHWHIGSFSANDTFFVLSKHFETSPNEFFTSFLPKIQLTASSYQSDWLKVKEYRQVRHKEFLADLEYSDFMVYHELFNGIPRDYMVQLANSAAVRYAQLFNSNPAWEVFCNRGTSGIDGSISTAIGAAVGSNKPTVMVTGDLSFFYDSNALWNNYIPNNFRIILINNSGGGIFRILPKAQEMDQFERYFETRHQLSAQPLCELYGFEYLKAKDEQDLKTALSDFFESSEMPKLLEIHTPPELNDKVLKAYFNAII